MISPIIHFSPVVQVDDLLVLEEQLDVDVRSLDTCQYAHSTFAEILNKIQKAVDDLSLHQYSNLHIWVQRLDEQVGLLLMTRLLELERFGYLCRKHLTTNL